MIKMNKCKIAVREKSAKEIENEERERKLQEMLDAASTQNVYREKKRQFFFLSLSNNKLTLSVCCLVIGTAYIFIFL
jgi:hypothetical protein